jgi:hypothetical protein
VDFNLVSPVSLVQNLTCWMFDHGLLPAKIVRLCAASVVWIIRYGLTLEGLVYMLTYGLTQ